MKKIYIGIDGGRETGLAVWNSETKAFLDIITTTFWGAIEIIQSYRDYSVNGKGLPGYSLTVVIENPAGNSPVFKAEQVYKGTPGGHVHKLAAAGFVASSVGSVKRESELMIEYCQRYSIDHRAITPGKRSMTKIDAAKFKQYTEYSKRTSQHGRDAGMLVFQL